MSTIHQLPERAVSDAAAKPPEIKHVGLKFLAALGVVGAVTTGIVAGNWGTEGRHLTRSELAAAATGKYNKAFDAQSPVGKFALQFMGTEDITIHNWVGSKGIEGNSSTSTVTFNNKCLANTAFQVRQGSINGSYSGIFSGGSVSGESVAATAYAEVDPSNPDVLEIISHQTGNATLKFSGLNEGSTLVPDDPSTKGVLEANGCESGVTRIALNH